MTKYSTASSAALIISLFTSIVHGQNYNERNGKLLKTSDDFQCFSEGLYIDPNDCSIFYRCVDWGESSENSIQSRFTSTKFRCAEGTVFDIERNNCVNVEETSRLECRQLADDDTFARISEREAGDPDYGVVQPSSEYNRPYQPPSYNRPGPAEPSEQTPGESGDGEGNNNESSSPSKSPPCEADGFFPIPNDCTHFYRCVSSGNGFLKYDFSCGPGTVWDPDNNACNHPWATSRPDCRSGTDGNQGGPETIEISESPETSAQVAEPSSTPTAATTTTSRPTTRPIQTSSIASKPSTTTTKRSTAGVSSTSTTTTTTESSNSIATTTDGLKENGTNAENSCTSEGFFPDGKNCTKFYRCVDEGNGKFTKYEFECAEGTVWDVQETTCNYPYAVQNENNCNSSNSESQTSTTSGQPSASTSSPSSQSSSRPSSSTTSSSYNRPTSTTSSSYNRPTATTSSSYNKPTSSTSSSYNRPTSQSSSSTNQQSSSSQTTSSSNQTTSSSSQTNSSNSSQTTSSSSQTTSSQQSSSSISTSSTSSSQQTTSSQQSSNSTSSTANQNSTSTSSTGSTTYSNSTSQASKGDKCSEEGFFSSSENCNKFYRCVSNEAGGFTKYNFNCGPGTVWDPENNVCNHPWAVKDEKCRSGGQGTTPLSESTTDSSTSSTENGTSPLTSSTSDSSNQTTTPLAESSTQPGTSALTTEGASKPTTTSENSNGTTTTDSTDVSTTPADNSTATTTESGSKNSTKPNNGIKCEKAGYYPNPKDCKKFYRCVDWDGDKGERFSVYHFDCPEGTIFDPSLNICNHEESVYPPRDCTGSGSQTTDSTPTSKPDNATTTESPGTTESTNTTDVTEISSSEPTTLLTTTDTSTNATEPTTTGSSETTTQVTTPSETTTKKEIETTTAITSVTTTPAYTTTPAFTTTSAYTTTPTTQISTIQPTTTEISTTPASNEACPDLGPDQYALVCPTGFRRHPKFCNLFYQCTVSKSMDTKIVILSCVNGTLYDEKKIQCLPPEETKKCEGSMMADARNLKKTDDSVSPIVVKSDKSICPNEGSFSYKDDCRLFYKCKKDDQGKLTGFLYQCPEGFAFWSISKRCEKTEKVPCENSKTSPTSWRSTLAPVESRNIGF